MTSVIKLNSIESIIIIFVYLQGEYERFKKKYRLMIMLRVTSPVKQKDADKGA